MTAPRAGLGSAARTGLAAFVVGAATLGLEIVAARVVALNVGVSLYSWTGVIGATLGGLALGSAIAARLADRPDRRTATPNGAEDLEARDRSQNRQALAAANRARLGCAVGAAAGYAPLAVVLLSMMPVVAALDPLPRLGRLALALALVALVPATLLGLAGPLLARLAIRSQATSGRTVGWIGAATTFGSLVGVLGAGLWLVPLVGVRGTALAAAVALAAVAVPARPRLGPLVLAALALGLGASVLAPHACDRESPYQCIRVADETTFEGDAVRVLYLDGLPHSYVAVDDPRHVTHDYTVPATELAAYVVAPTERPLRFLVIGGGGYVLPRYLAAVYPGAIVDVLELDPAVTAMARLRLGLQPDAPIVIHHGDARRTIDELPPDRRYDLAVLDAFSDVVVPYHLVTREFDRQVAARLDAGGFYAALVHDLPEGRLLGAVARTVQDTFGRVDVLAAGPGVRWDRPVPRTWTVVGSQEGISPDRLRTVLRETPHGPFPPLSEVMPPEHLAELLAVPGPSVLTDDYAPVEQLAAPLFR